MNTKEYEEFIMRLYNAGEHNTDAIKEMHTFAEQPGSLQIILDSINSHEISEITLLISLSMIPHVTMTSSDNSFLRSWFPNYITTDSESLLSDAFLAYLVNIFLFIYQNDQKEGATLIQSLSEGGQPQQILAIQMSLQLIEKSEKISNSDYLIQIALLPFIDNESSPQLIDSASLLLKQLLTSKKSGLERKELQLNTIYASIQANFPKRIFRFLMAFQELDHIVNLHLLQLFDTFVSFPPSFYPTQMERNKFILSSVTLFFNYLNFNFGEEINFSAINIPEQLIPVICSIFLSIKKSSSVLINEDSLDSKKELQPLKRTNKEKNLVFLFDDLIWHASVFTQFILSDAEYLNYLELILDFWISNDIYSSLSNHKTGMIEMKRILDDIVQKFFTNDVLQIDQKISEILTDNSSKMVKKIAQFSSFNRIAVCERCCTFLTNELNQANLAIAAFLVKFLAYAGKHCDYIVVEPQDKESNEKRIAVFDLILKHVYNFQRGIEPQLSILFELSLVKFYRLLLKKFVIEYSDPLRDFFIRFMIDIQSTTASIEVIQAVISLLKSNKIKDFYLTIIGQNGEAFDLIVKSQIVSAPMADQPKKVTTMIFQIAFQLGFLNRDPSQVVSLIEMIIGRIENNANDTVSYLMMSGGFLASNCQFESFYITLTERFFPILLKKFQEFVAFTNEPPKAEEENGETSISSTEEAAKSETCTNPSIAIDVLHLFHSIASTFCEQKIGYLSTIVVNFAELTLKVINLALDVSDKIDRQSIDSLKIVSLVSLILADLLVNGQLNFGVLEFYKNLSFQATLNRLIESFIMIPFDAFEQNPKLIDRYLILMNAVIGEYLTFILSLDGMIIQHHLQALIFIFNIDDQTFSPRAQKILTLMASSLYQYEIPIFEEKCSTAMRCILQNALNRILKLNFIKDYTNELMYTYLMNFHSLRNSFFDAIIEKIGQYQMMDELQLIFSRIKSSFNEIDNAKALNLFELSLKSLIGYARNHGIDISL